MVHIESLFPPVKTLGASPGRVSTIRAARVSSGLYRVSSRTICNTAVWTKRGVEGGREGGRVRMRE